MIFPRYTGCPILCLFTTYICYSASSHSNVMCYMLYSRKTWVLCQEIHWKQVLETPSNNGFLLSSLEERTEQLKFGMSTVLKVLLPSELRILTPHWTSYQCIDFGWLVSVLVPVLASFVSVQTECSCTFFCPSVNLWYRIFPQFCMLVFTHCCWYWLLFYRTLIGIFLWYLLCHRNGNECSSCSWRYLSHALSTVCELCTWLSACLTFQCW